MYQQDDGTWNPMERILVRQSEQPYDISGAPLSILYGWGEQAKKDRNALDVLFQGAVMSGDLDKATRLANTPEQRAMLDVAYRQRAIDQDRRARIDAGKQYDAPTDLVGDYARAQEAKLARARMEEDRKMKIQKFFNDQAKERAQTALSLANERKANAAAQKSDKEAAMLEKTGGVKLGQGQRFTQDGTVELIEGTPQYRKEADKHAKDYGALQAINTKTDNAVKKIDEILDPKNEGGFNSQFGGYNAYLTRIFPGQAQDVGAKIDSLKANMKTAGLELIRAGGSIGQMTEREWPIVQDQLDKLDPRMSEKSARAAFANIKANFDRIRNNAKEIYDTEWSGTQFSKRTGVGSADIPDAAIQYLRANPQYRTAFDMKYGQGASARALGQ